MTESVTFREPALEAEYRREGFVVAPLLDRREIEHLLAGYRALVPPGDHGLTIDFMRPDRTYMHQIAELIEPVWARHFPELFVDHRPVLTSFITKHPGPTSNMFLHEDRTLVDERHFRSGTLWVPLVDVGPDLDNGGLQLIPKSHLLNEVMAGTDTPELFRPYTEYLEELLQTAAMPAGHALYYDTRTLHASPPNLSSAPREAIVCAVAPRAADLIHVVGTSRRHRRVHRVDEAFFLEVHPHTVRSEEIEERYPVLMEFDDDSRLGPDRVVELLGADRPAGTAGPRRPQPAIAGVRVGERRLPLLHRDLPLRAADLSAPQAVRSPHLDVEQVYGAVGTVAVDRNDDATWTDLVRPLATDVPVAAMVAVDARSRAVIRLAGGPTDEPWMIDVVDVGTCAADLDVGDSSLLLDETMTLEIDPGVAGALRFTNRGVGPLALLLTCTRVPALGLPQATSRARRLGRRLRSVVSG
jgi:hypothetical protein